MAKDIIDRKEVVDVIKGSSANFGRRGENLAREVIFDITALKKDFPNGVFSLVLCRLGETETYKATTVTIVGNELRYKPTSWATEMVGEGSWEIHVQEQSTGVYAKSAVGRYFVSESLDQPVENVPQT